MQVLRSCSGPASAPFACSCRQGFTCTGSCLSPQTLHRHLGLVHGHCACAAGYMCSGCGAAALSPRQTLTHLFEEGDRIGKGGSCDVFCGVEKGTGARHALKVLREPSYAQQTQLLQEAETLSKLSSSKVVKFYGQNYELESGRPVVILELCTGGSLLTFLQLPENARGLDDDQYRQLLADLVEGLSFLRAKGIVHRDIKPGNILRKIHASGKCEYKLTDFGTSREATDTEQMTSIVGTEEYLHPVMYKNAFFGTSRQSPLNPTSGELWSLGCTLYHAATASVPFRPIGGARNNRNAMLVMISQKPPGAISGDQSLDGNFRWSKVLPGDCRMSDLAELQDALAYHTELPASQQLLFHRVQPLLTMLGTRTLVKDLPVTQADQPLLLLEAHDTEGRCRRHAPAPPQPMPSGGTLEEDIASSFKVCSELHVLWLMATALHGLPNILFSAILALRNALTSTLSTVETRFRVLSATCQERQSRLAILTCMLEMLRPASPGGQHPKIAQARQLCDQLRDNLWQLKYRLNEVRRTADVSRLDNSLPHTLCQDDSASALGHIFSSAREIWQRIQDRREKVPLSQIEQEKHEGDRRSLNRLCVEGTTRIKDMHTKRAKLLEQYTTQVRQLCEKLTVSEDIDGELQSLKMESEQFSTLLDEIWTSAAEDLRRLVEASRSTVVQTATPLHNRFSQMLAEGLPSLETFHLSTPDVGLQRDGYSREQQTSAERRTEDK